MKKYCIGIFLVLILNQVSAQTIPPFKAGERVVFAGNSITDGGHYHSYIWLYYMTRFPDMRIDVFNAGIGGDVANQIYERLDDDVLVHKPTYLALTFGMNDSDYAIYGNKKADSISAQRIKTSYESYLKMEAILKTHSEIKKVIVASSPYDETVKLDKNYFPGKSATMLKIAAFQEASAKTNKWSFLDFNRPITAINLRGQQSDPMFTICGNDRIHPGNDGHMVMAYLFLSAQGLEGKRVAAVEINASNKKIISTDNCAVTSLSSSKNAVSFDYLANALPFPVDHTPRGWEEKKSAAHALSIVPFTAKFNDELFKISGLESGNYALMIDGIEIIKATGEQFAAGINLAIENRTPQYQQAQLIMELNEERFEKERKLRQYAWLQYSFFKDKGLLHADNLAALDTLNRGAEKNMFVGWNRDNYQKSRFKEVRELWRKEIAMIIDQIYALNKPVKHRIEIKRLGN
jgi:lysophospholipase L1-like esterase